jgi:hypothetical protein
MLHRCGCGDIENFKISEYRYDYVYLFYLNKINNKYGICIFDLGFIYFKFYVNYLEFLQNKWFSFKYFHLYIEYLNLYISVSSSKLSHVNIGLGGVIFGPIPECRRSDYHDQLVYSFEFCCALFKERFSRSSVA